MKEKLNARWPQPYQRVAVGAALLTVLYVFALIFWIVGGMYPKALGYTGDSETYSTIFDALDKSFLFVLPLLLTIAGIGLSASLFVLRGHNAKLVTMINLGVAAVTFLFCTITVLVIKGEVKDMAYGLGSIHVNFGGILHFIFMLLVVACAFYVYTQGKIGGVDHSLTPQDMINAITGKSAPAAFGGYGAPAADPNAAARPKFCSGCGAPLTPGTSFCGACGKKN